MSFTDGLELRRGDGADPEVFTRVGGVKSLSGLGEANPTIDVTDWDSTAKEYIAGLADGQEVTIELNRELENTQQSGLIEDIQNKVNRNFELDLDNGTSTETYSFQLAMTSWSISPNKEDAHILSVSGKLSGSIGRAVTPNA